MKTKIVPSEELNPEKSLRAEDYVEKEDFTADQLYAAHTFRYVDDPIARIAVCGMAYDLHHAFTGKEGREKLAWLIKSPFIRRGDKYVSDELALFFEETIWRGKV